MASPEPAVFGAWLEASRERNVPPLAFAEVRRGVQALSTLYVERRREGRLPARALDGAGKRAAFATFYAPLHFLVTYAAAGRFFRRRERVFRRVVDLGCGTGVAGAAAALALAPHGARPPVILAIDVSSWALVEARHTHRAFGLAGRTLRGSLPAAFPRVGAGDLIVLAWAANELDEPARDGCFARIESALAAGAGLLLLEPLARGAAPWWTPVAKRLAPHGIADAEIRIEPSLPEWIERLDAASGLDHRELGARVMHGPGPVTKGGES
jgi:hypothetical protein